MKQDLESFVKGLKKSTQQHKSRRNIYGGQRYNEAIKKDLYFFIKKETGIEAKTPSDQRRVIVETAKARANNEQHFLEFLPIIGQFLPFVFGNGNEAAAAAEQARREAEEAQRRQTMYLIFGSVAAVIVVILLIKK